MQLTNHVVWQGSGHYELLVYNILFIYSVTPTFFQDSHRLAYDTLLLNIRTVCANDPAGASFGNRTPDP